MNEALADNADPLVVRDEHVFIRGPAVKFNVGSGDTKQEFIVHRKLFEGRFTEDCYPKRSIETGNVELKYEDPDIFELYIQHLYTGDIPCRQTKIYSSMSYEYQDLMLVKFFALAEALYDETAMHAALQAFLWSFRRLQKARKPAAPSIEIMRHAYQLTATGSSLIKLLVDMYIWDDMYDDSMSGRLPELANDIARAATEKWRCQSRLDEWEHAVCCDYFDDSDKCRSMKRKRGEDDGEIKEKRRRVREETSDDGLA